MTTSTDDRIASLIDRLVESARPVRRLWPPAARLVAWLGVLLAVGTVVEIAGLRPDVGARLASPGFLAEIACLGAATVAGAWVALRGAVPGLDAGRGRRVLAATVVAGGALGLAGTRFSPATPFATFVDAGVPCALTSVVLALVPWAAVLWAVRRGVTLRPVPTYAAAGLAASLAAYALMRLRCPLDETVHVAVWHGTPVVFSTILAAAVGIVAWRHRRPPV
jgi:hypothetical protein